ncbi:MAG: glycosyltransferase family 39 protein [Bacteroidales bacterium]|nr:glycosyltransferase family 39 protein [Bacteroidales bacterium]
MQERMASALLLQPHNYKRKLLVLLGISILVRGFIAGMFELGNDEVYYWTYAVYPDISHFDHPPMVGWLIRIFTLNLQFQQEFFVRLASVIGGTFNTYILFLIGTKLRDETTGWYTALLHIASIYGFVISGVFILPDTPQTVFWLSALYLMLDVLPENQPSGSIKRKMIGIGILLGLGMLSKYTTAFLWAGMILFILLFNRSWLKRSYFYLANLIMLSFFAIVLVWNFRNNFISFTYQGGRGLVSGLVFNIDSFLTELLGEVLYNNPVNLLLLILGIVIVIRSSNLQRNPSIRILLLTGLPLVLTFLSLSLFRGTLPHWSGPGYLTLIPVAALFIRIKQGEHPSFFPGWMIASLLVMGMILSVAMFQISTGLIPLESKEDGRRDYSLDIYGWTQMGEKFKILAEKYEAEGKIQTGSPIVSYRWFPAANLEYYAARPGKRHVLASGKLEEIHKYAWINKVHGGFRLNDDAWYITSSLDFREPEKLYELHYEKIMPPDTLHIVRRGKNVYAFYVYRLLNLQSKPRSLLVNH